MLPEEERYYRVALTLVPGIGARRAAILLNNIGSATAIFRSGLFHDFDKFAAVDRTFAFTRKHDIRILCPFDPEYPIHLTDCADAPTVLYYKGNPGLHPLHTLSVVGTRTPSAYGQQAVRSIIRELSAYNVLIVSGLADGIDALAHRCALDNGLPTLGILGHGMHTIYPTGNRLLAAEMLKNGGLLTEFRETEGPEAAHFPMRNRIIAGMSEATLVVESGIEGGSMITAKLAYGYNRAVLAIPGRLTDVKSNGCNALMAGDAAHCVTTAEDIARRLQWDIRPTPSVRTHTGSPVMDILGPGDPIHIDDLLARSGLPRNSLSTQLLILELEGTIESLPGNRYRLIF